MATAIRAEKEVKGIQIGSFGYGKSAHTHNNPRNTEEAEVERFYEDLQYLLELTPQKDVLFIVGDWNAKVGSQETSGVTGKFGPGVTTQTRLTGWACLIYSWLVPSIGEDLDCD